MALAAQLGAVVQSTIIPKVADNVFRSNATFELFKYKEAVTLRGGENIRMPLTTAAAGSVGSYSPYDPLSSTPNQQLSYATFEWRNYFGNQPIAEVDLKKASGDSAVIDLLMALKDNLEYSLRDTLGTHLWSDNTAGAGIDIDGLRLLLSTTATYGGIAVADLATWAAQIDATAGTITLLKAERGIQAATEDSDGPDLMVSNSGIHNDIYFLMIANQRYIAGVKEQIVEIGAKHLVFDGIPYFIDRKTPGSGVSGATGQYLVFLNTRWIQLAIHEARNFEGQVFPPVANQDVYICGIKTMLNLICNNRRMQSAFTNLTNS